jgi:hypothetical protein
MEYKVDFGDGIVYVTEGSYGLYLFSWSDALIMSKLHSDFAVTHEVFTWW